jgi:hypothetical protein
MPTCTGNQKSMEYDWMINLGEYKQCIKYEVLLL